jgi:hypothetical protein
MAPIPGQLDRAHLMNTTHSSLTAIRCRASTTTAATTAKRVRKTWGRAAATNTCNDAMDRRASPIVQDDRVLANNGSGHRGLVGSNIRGSEVGCGGGGHGIL